MSIRWDAVVDRSPAASGKSPPLQSRNAAAQPQGQVKVRVRLYGALASLSAQQTLQFDLDASTTLADTLAYVGQRLGDAFLMHVLDDAGKKRRHCRLYVGGYPIEELHTPLSSTFEPSDIDIILLVAPEGG